MNLRQSMLKLRWSLAMLKGVVFLVVLSGCHQNPEQTKLQYMPDMADAPVPKAQASFLPPPEHSVAMGALLYPKTVEEAEKVLTMPPRIAGDQASVEAGKHLFETFCSVCHGLDAKGEGTLGAAFPRPPDLTHDVYKARADGFFFYRITFGSAIMPAYGYAVSPHERWMIVKYLRTLQGTK